MLDRCDEPLPFTVAGSPVDRKDLTVLRVVGAAKNSGQSRRLGCQTARFICYFQ